MRKSDGNTTKENSPKKTPYTFYNLRLGDDKTVIPVDSSERCNEEVRRTPKNGPVGKL